VAARPSGTVLLWPGFLARTCRFPRHGSNLMLTTSIGATAELESRGYRTLIKNKKEPWGQTVTRFLSTGGIAGWSNNHSIDAAVMSAPSCESTFDPDHHEL